jgi:hypothetical protein
MWGPCGKSIVRRPYWRRTWIVQEICLATDVQIVTGSRSFSWEILHKAVEKTTGTYHHNDADAYAKEAITHLVSIRKSLESGHEVKLLDVLNRTVLLKATDIRDKMYGLLGLTSDGPDVIPSPNYGLTVETVVNSTMRAIATSEKTLDVLAAKMAFEEPRQSSPSWHPAWELYLWKTKGSTNWYKTCQRATQINSPARSSFPFDVTHDLVITHSIELDMIDGIGAFDSNRPSLFEISQALHKDRQKYQTALGVFIALDACLFATEDASPNGWKHLITAFASNSRFASSAAFASNSEFSPDAPWAMLNSTSTHLLKYNAGLIVSGRTLKDWAESLYSDCRIKCPGQSELRDESYKEYFSEVNRLNGWGNQGMTVTKDGYLGLVHPKSRRGDKICLLHAFRNIVILRPWKDDGYKIVGYASIDGLMKGEKDFLLERLKLTCFRIY